MKRAIVIVIDSMGCGAMNDCRDYNDDINNIQSSIFNSIEIDYYID